MVVLVPCAHLSVVIVLLRTCGGEECTSYCGGGVFNVTIVLAITPSETGSFHGSKNYSAKLRSKHNVATGIFTVIEFSEQKRH